MSAIGGRADIPQTSSNRLLTTQLRHHQLLNLFAALCYLKLPPLRFARRLSVGVLFDHRRAGRCSTSIPQELGAELPARIVERPALRWRTNNHPDRWLRAAGCFFMALPSLTLAVFADGHKTSGALRSNPGPIRLRMPGDRGRRVAYPAAIPAGAATKRGEARPPRRSLLAASLARATFQLGRMFRRYGAASDARNLEPLSRNQSGCMPTQACKQNDE